MSRSPRSWQKSLKAGLLPLSALYAGGIGIKNRLFESGWLEVKKIPVPVISIGNLSMGGTGKTPFVDLCLKKLTPKFNVGVVSRAYKADAQDPVRVDVQNPRAARVFGDEPVWLARENPQALFFVGQNKRDIAEWACQQEPLDVVVVDDGFQHRALHRDLDIVLLDATESEEDSRLIPAGRARESFSALDRADLVVISKSNWVSSEKLQNLRQKIPVGKSLVELSAELKECVRWGEPGKVRKMDSWRGREALIFSSIATPEIFRQQVISSVGPNVQAIVFPDHHQYQPVDIKRITAAATTKSSLAGPEKIILCTEKDAVKLQGLWPADIELWISKMKVEISRGEGELDAHFARILA